MGLPHGKYTKPFHSTSHTHTISLRLLEAFFSQFVSIIFVHCTSDLNDADILHMNNQKITKVNITQT